MKKTAKEKRPKRSLLARIGLWLTGDQTYCDGCKRFSWGDVCPYC